jgi:hypothetical protein
MCSIKVLSAIIFLVACSASTTEAPVSTTETVYTPTDKNPTDKFPDGSYVYQLGNSLLVEVTLNDAASTVDFGLVINQTGLPGVPKSWSCTGSAYSFGSVYADVVIPTGSDACLASIAAYVGSVNGGFVPDPIVLLYDFYGSVLTMNLLGESIDLLGLGANTTVAPIETTATVSAATTVPPTTTQWVSVSGPSYGPSGVYLYDVGNAFTVFVTYYPSLMLADFALTNDLPGMPDINKSFNCTGVPYTFNATFGVAFSGMPDVTLDTSNDSCMQSVEAYFDTVTGPAGVDAFTAAYDDVNNVVMMTLFNALTPLNAVNYGPLGEYTMTQGGVQAQFTFYQYSSLVSLQVSVSQAGFPDVPKSWSCDNNAYTFDSINNTVSINLTQNSCLSSIAAYYNLVTGHTQESLDATFDYSTSSVTTSLFGVTVEMSSQPATTTQAPFEGSSTSLSNRQLSAASSLLGLTVIVLMNLL